MNREQRKKNVGLVYVILFVCIVCIAIVIANSVILSKNESEEWAVSSVTRTGVITKQNDRFVLVFEAPGAPALTKILIVSERSRCEDMENRRCMSDLSSYIGERVMIAGVDVGFENMEIISLVRTQ
jgi:hypothetical protein